MKKSWVFWGGAGAVCFLSLWGCEFNTVDRASQYTDSYEASAPPVKDAAPDTSKPPTSNDAGSTQDSSSSSSDAGDGGNG